jgi:hypothetical protein
VGSNSLAVATSTIFLTGGYVGIGTTTLSQTLTIKGTSTNPILGIWSSSTTPVLYIGQNAYVGIATTTPQYTLDVYGSAALGTGPEAMTIDTTGYVGIGTTTPNFTLTVGKKGDATSTYRVGVYGSIEATGSIDPAKSFDIAERFPIDPQCKINNNCPEAGDLVSIIENEIVQKSSASYDSKLIGIVSENSAITMGGLDASTSRPVALAGRLLVKISTENGSIATGDLLTSASLPGLAMKATEAGRVIGIALESFEQTSSATSKILAFVNPHWYAGKLAIDGSLSTTTEGTTATTTEETSIVQDTGIFDEFIEKVKQALASLGLFVENGIAQVKELIADKIFAKKAQVEDLEVLNKIQLLDQTTGEIYCTWIENGEWVKLKSSCENLTNSSSSNNQSNSNPEGEPSFPDGANNQNLGESTEQSPAEEPTEQPSEQSAPQASESVIEPELPGFSEPEPPAESPISTDTSSSIVNNETATP